MKVHQEISHRKFEVIREDHKDNRLSYMKKLVFKILGFALA